MTTYACDGYPTVVTAMEIINGFECRDVIERKQCDWKLVLDPRDDAVAEEAWNKHCSEDHLEPKVVSS